VLAIQVAQVDQMSGGRAELGLGAGWFATEHSAYGIPFPDNKFELLEEQLAIVTGLWRTPGDGDLLVHREDLPAGGLARAAQARAAPAPADHHRRRRAEAHPAAGRAVRRRVQRGLPRRG